MAAVLRDGTLPGLGLTVTPGRRQILDTIVQTGVTPTWPGRTRDALEPACGPCVGDGTGAALRSCALRTFNRNFPGRSGTPDDR